MDSDKSSAQEISREALVKLVHDDVQRYDSLVRDHLSRIYQLLVLVFTVAGISGSLLYGYHQYGVLLGIPIVGCIALFIGANLTGEMFALAAHKFFLEQILSKLVGDSLAPELRYSVPPPWDSAGGRIRRTSISYVAIQISYIVSLLVVSAVAIAVAWVKMGNFWWLAPIAVLSPLC